LQDRIDVDVPLRAKVTLGALKEQEMPAGACMLRLTPPAKLDVPTSVIVELPTDPELIDEGLTFPAVIVKSPTWTICPLECEEPPGTPVAVMVTPYAPRVVELNEQAAVTVRFDERVTGETGQETDRPVGVAAPVRLTFPLKLLTLVSVTVMVTPVCPRFRFAADVVTVKSPT